MEEDRSRLLFSNMTPGVLRLIRELQSQRQHAVRGKEDLAARVAQMEGMINSALADLRINEETAPLADFTDQSLECLIQVLILAIKSQAHESDCLRREISWQIKSGRRASSENIRLQKQLNKQIMLLDKESELLRKHAARSSRRRKYRRY